MQASNLDELPRRLAREQGSLLLADAGPADGPGAGFGFSNTAKVMTAGPYTVTATCVGTPSVQILLSEDGAEPLSLDVDCSGVLSKVDVLRNGYIEAQLTRHDPTGAWKGRWTG